MSTKPSDSKIIKELQEKIKILEVEKTKLEILCKDNDLLDDVEIVSDTEAICVAQIKRLREISITANFTETDSKILDILHKNLRMAKGQKTEDRAKKRKMKSMSNAELLNLVPNE